VHVALDGGEHDAAAGGALRPLHELLQVAHRGLHGLGGLEHLGHDELIVVEEAADLFHALHEGAVDDVQRRRVAPLGLQILHQPVPRALHDVAGQALVQGQRRARHPGLLLLPRK
jgi:hypothetical protein